MADPVPAELPEQASIDPWSAYLPGQELVPAYLVSRYAAQYRLIVDVLLGAQDSSLTGMAFTELATAVRQELATRFGDAAADRLTSPDTFSLDQRMEQLESWQVVTRWQDPARTGEDFLRRRDRYQLTPRAAALHSFWTTVDGDEDAAGDLTLAPRAIHDRLVAFGGAVRAERYPAAAGEWQQVIALHQATARAARGWQRTLAHALSGGPDRDKQDLLWRTLQAYIAMWGEQVDVYSPRITELIGDLSPRLAPDVWRACVRGALAEDAPEQLVAEQADRWAVTWTALAGWFAGADGQARRLRRQLRDLVAPWARNMNILLDTGGAVTRRAELLQLAVAIERAPDDDTARRMWATATGTFSARHLLLPAPAPHDHALSWAVADPAPVTARFREQGSRAAVGRRATSSDYSTGRAAARQARAAALAARQEAEALLRRRSGSCFSEWDPLTGAELDLLLELMATARRTEETGRAAGHRTAVTANGRWRVTLSVPDGRPAEVTVLESDRGSLATRDWRFELEPP